MWAAALAPAVVAGIAVVVHALRFDFLCDDAYISFRYAENLARHGVLEWNVGERVEGYTNFLWTVLLALWTKVGVGPEVASRVMGLAFGASGAILLYGISLTLNRETEGPDRWSPTDPFNYLAGFLTAACAAYACWCSGGLETQMFTFLSLAGFALYLHEETSGRRFRWSGAVMALAAMTRPEGVGLFFVMGLHRLAYSIVEVVRAVRSGRKTGGKPPGKAVVAIILRDLAWALGFVLLYGGYFLWRYRYYGLFLPNSYYVKASSPDPDATRRLGWAYLYSFLRDYKLVWVLFALPFGFLMAVLRSFKSRRIALFMWLYCIGATTLVVWHVTRVGGDFMAMHRFWVPLVPLLALMIQETLREGCALLVRRAEDRMRLAVALLVIAVPVAAAARFSSVAAERTLTTLTVHAHGYHGDYDNMESVTYMRKFAGDRVRIGRWLKARVPKGSWMAVGGAGAIVYSSGLNAIDSFGLMDLYVAHKLKPIRSRPGHQKLAPMHYLVGRRPDIICSPHVTRFQDREHRPSLGERRRWERQGYQYFCATPRGIRPTHYCCLMRLDKDLNIQPVSAYRY